MSLADFERNRHSPGHSGFHLERMALLLGRFGDPHLAVPAVHVAGTKGKGSVSAMIASVLAAGGRRTGLYTSPHLHTVRERIQVNGVPVTESQFAGLVERSWPVVTDVGAGTYGGVSTFEMMTLMAFLHFRDSGAEAQVVEVGLGGRLDSTNLITPLVSVITPISLDHTATLGNTVEKIAAEKAGIIKPGVPVVVSPQPPGSDKALGVIRETALAHNARVIEVGEEATWSSVSSGRQGQRFRVRTARGDHSLSMPLLGPHQVENAATALVALDQLEAHGLRPSPNALASGLASVVWPCRVEYLPFGGSGAGRVVVADGAHNEDSIDRLLESVPELRRGGVVLVFGALSGHSASGMLQRLASLSPRVVVVSSRHPRAVRSSDLADLVRERGLAVIGSYETVADGMRHALKEAEPGQEAEPRGKVVLATGSISVAAEAREWALGIEPECYPNIRPPDDSPRRIPTHMGAGDASGVSAGP
jgi:dihydrofolate synthase/folylpolyglutamate synthase